jgi:hypothetical protein
MTRSKSGEVSTVERCELWFTESLGDRQHRSVDQADIRVGILVAQVAGASVIVGLQVFHTVSTRDDVIQQGNENAGVQTLVDPIVHLYQDKGSYHQRLDCLLYELPAASVGGIVAVQRGGPVSSTADPYPESVPRTWLWSLVARPCGSVGMPGSAQAEASRSRPVAIHFALECLTNQLGHRCAPFGRHLTQALVEVLGCDDGRAARDITMPHDS